MTAEDPGCYVHYLPTHGPNLWDHNSVRNDFSVTVPMRGVLVPQWAVGFARPFEERIAVEFDGDTVVAVRGTSADAKILREMLIGGRMIEGGGCGFNPEGAAPHDLSGRARTRRARCTSASTSRSRATTSARSCPTGKSRRCTWTS